jgi:hypothetical protein
LHDQIKSLICYHNKGTGQKQRSGHDDRNEKARAVKVLMLCEFSGEKS